MKLIGNLGISLISLIVMVGLSEIYLRSQGHTPKKLYNNPTKQASSIYSFSKQDDELGWVNRVGTIKSHEHGQHLMHFTKTGARKSYPGPSKFGSEHVLIVGGSYTQSYGVIDEASYPFKLNQMHPNKVFSNYGVGGFGTYQSHLMMKRVIRQTQKTPNLVIYGYIGHHMVRNVATLDWLKAIRSADGKSLIPPHVWKADNPKGFERFPYKLIKLWPLENKLALVALAHKHVTEKRFKGRQNEAQKLTVRLLKAMHEELEGQNSRLLIVLLQDDDILYSNNYGKIEPKLHAQANLNVLNCEHPDLYKPRKPGQPNPLLLGGTGHVIPEVHTHWANCIAGWIKENPKKVVGQAL